MGPQSIWAGEFKYFSENSKLKQLVLVLACCMLGFGVWIYIQAQGKIMWYYTSKNIRGSQLLLFLSCENFLYDFSNYAFE